MSKRLLLQEFGLNDISATIYLFLVEHGSSTILQISRGTGIARTNIYNKLEELKKYSLVSEGISGNKKVIVPESPNNLKNILQNRLELAEQSLDILTAGFIRERSDVKLKFYHGKDGFKQCLNNIVNSNKKNFFQILNNKNFTRFTKPNIIQKFENKRIDKKINFKILIPYIDSNDISKNINEIEAIKSLKEIRFLPKEVACDISIIFNDSELYLFTTPDEGYILYLESPSVAKSFSGIFNNIWKNSKRINQK